MAATPAMSVYPILAQRYGDGQTAALSMLLMTLLSFVTLTVTLTLTV
jgi:predicted permease